MKGVKKHELYSTIRPSSQLQVILEAKEKTFGLSSISGILSFEATMNQFRACRLSSQLGGLCLDCLCLDRSGIATSVVLVVFFLLAR
jgi:hypothetical protein